MKAKQKIGQRQGPRGGRRGKKRMAAQGGDRMGGESGVGLRPGPGLEGEHS